MSYSIYFKQGSKNYKLPVNPEEIKVNRKMQIETYSVLASGQVSVPAHCSLEEYSFEAEFPGRATHYVETAGSFLNSDHFETLFRKAQQNQTVLRFIASNGITEDISKEVLVESLEIVEKAGEEGDKYMTIKLLEYKEPNILPAVIPTSETTAEIQEEPAPEENPAVTDNKTHTVVKGDTLWAIAKKYYGNGALYPRIVEANSGIKNPNLIYPGQVFTIPA